MSKRNTESFEQQLLDLQNEVDELRKYNTDLEERLKAYSLINTGQISLINKLIDKVPFGVMLLDEKFYVIHANDAAGKILAIPTADMKGRPYDQFFNGYELPDLLAGQTAEGEVALQSIYCANTEKHVLHSTFISDEGSKKVIVSTFVDISEIKQAEQELIKVNKVKDEFLGMISHELRTPLNVIQGYNSLLEDEVGKMENPDADSYIEKINSAGEVLLHVVNNLLELSDLTAGKIKVDNIPIDLEMIVTQLKYRLEKIFAERNNKLVFSGDAVNPFEQDFALLLKVLYELLSNANKFTKDGEVKVSTSLLTKGDTDWICFEIADTGCGMSEETMQQIFSAFSQGDSSLTRSYEGLGLGLSLAEKSVRMIGGYIEVESEYGKGSRFTVTVPYQLAS